MEPPEEVQSNGKSPISSTSAEVDEETEIGLQQLQGGGDDPLQSPQLPQMETRSRRQRASPSTYNEAVLLGESPPSKSTSKPKTKKKGPSTKKGGAKAAALQDRKRRKVVPTEWAPENVFDIIQHTSYPTPTTLGGEDGQIRQGDDVVCPPALEPVTAHELKRMRLEAERSGHPHSQREAAGLAQPCESPQTPMAMAAADTPTDASLQKMSIATLLASGPASSSAPPPLAEVSSLSINDIINAPGNDENILAAEDFFSTALSPDTAADAVLGSIASQPEDEEVRQEWDKLADLLQEEQDKIQQEAKLNQQIPAGEEKVKHEAVVAAEAPSPPVKSGEEPLEETKQEAAGLPLTEAAGQDRSPQADAHNDALPAAVVDEQLPYGYLELDDEKEEEEDSEDEYVEAGGPVPSLAKGGKGGRGKASTTKGRAKGKAKGKTAAAKGQRKGRNSGGAAGKTTGTRKSGRRSQQDELALPMDDLTAYTSTTTSPSTLSTSPLLSPAAPAGSGPSVAALAQLRKLEELHRRECTNGRETGCKFCSILDCKWGNEDHYRKEQEGGCPCRETETALPAASPSEEKAVTRGRTRSGRKSAEGGYASAADTSLEDEIMALDASVDADLLGSTKGEGSKGEKRKRFEVEDFNRPDELPLATLKLDSTKAVIDKTLIKEGKSVTSGYYKEAYSWADRTFINCDLRYYNLASLGKFDAILIDPPWRIKGNQLISNEKTMFNNSKWGLSYGTMSNDEIIDIDVGCLSDKGFIFLWVINSQIEFGFKCLQKWGYTYVDRITWVKKTASGNIAISQGYYFLHSSEICLVGVKYDAKGKSLEFISKTSNDLLFAEIREKSRKPDQLYHIIERMVPGGRKVEIFARNHNMRPGWLSLGNQLGEYYDWDHDLIRCDMCNGSIPTGKTRYKSRTVADSDLCAACYQKSGGSPEQYFEIENVMAEMAFHQYFACDGCETKPLWGLRFHCTQCDDCDLCELCYDKKTLPAHLKDTHSVDHKFDVIEMPDLAGGLPVHHEYRCMGCMTKPIIGYRFVCLACNGLSLCQKCFFLRKEPRNHKANHNMDIIVDSSNYDQFKCAVCALFPIKPVVYKCTSCLNYDLCESCHHDCAPPPATNTSHKPSHKFKMITVSTGN